MTGSTKMHSANWLTPREAVRFVLMAALSEGLALGFLDVSLSLCRRPGGALRDFGVALAPVAASSGAFFFVIFLALLPFALLPARTAGEGKGALLVSLATGWGTCLGL